MARSLIEERMIKSAIPACAVILLAVLTFWPARDAVAWPNRGSYSPVATVRQEYSDPSKVRQAMRAVEDVAAGSGFVLSEPPSREDYISLNYLRTPDGVEILIASIGEPNVLKVYVYDRLRRGTWEEIKNKVESAMNSIQ